MWMPTVLQTMLTQKPAHTRQRQQDAVREPGGAGTLAFSSGNCHVLSLGGLPSGTWAWLAPGTPDLLPPCPQLPV